MADHSSSLEKNEVKKLLFGRKECAEVCSMSVSSWDRACAMQKTPRPLKILCRMVWRVSDIEEWIRLGMPDRKTFEIIQRDTRI